VKAAADAASAPVSVVDALGTAVHLWPFMEVIENPAGRFAFVDIAKMKSDAWRRREGTNQPSREGYRDHRSKARRPSIRSFKHSVVDVCEYRKEQKSTWEKTVGCRWMKKLTGSTDLKHPAFRRESGVGELGGEWEGRKQGGHGWKWKWKGLGGWRGFRV
jgi:hypothetical protein